MKKLKSRKPGMKIFPGNPPKQTTVPGQNKLVITATEECWIHSNADKNRYATVFLCARGHFCANFAKKPELKLGNAGGVRLRYNGKDLPTSRDFRAGQGINFSSICFLMIELHDTCFVLEKRAFQGIRYMVESFKPPVMEELAIVCFGGAKSKTQVLAAALMYSIHWIAG